MVRYLQAVLYHKNKICEGYWAVWIDNNSTHCVAIVNFMTIVNVEHSSIHTQKTVESGTTLTWDG